MSALDDLLLKKYRESIGEPVETVSSEVAESPAPPALEPNYLSGGAQATTLNNWPVPDEPAETIPEQETLVYSSVDTSSAVVESPAARPIAQNEETYELQPEQGISLEAMREVLGIAAPDHAAAETPEPEIAAPETPESDNSAPEILAPAGSVADLAAPETHESESTAPAISSPPPTAFKPDWEIDRFPWPAICDKIEDRLETELGRAMASLTEACESRSSNTVIITSARSGIGRTTMTLCLAREAARQGKTVAIVDLDHADPSMLECMGIEFEQGIESLQGQEVTAESICVTAVQEGVSLLPTANSFNPTQCTTPETRDLLRVVAEHHDLVLIDASREVADLLAELDDVPTQGVIMVSEPGAAQATQAFVEWMKEKNAWTLGVIENFAA